MMNEKNQKIVLVTGGSRGLGREMALSLAKSGFDVIITYRNNKAMAEEVVAAISDNGRQALALPLDMSQAGAIAPFIARLREMMEQKWGKAGLFGLVNNAGMGATVPFAQVTEEIFDEFMQVHFKGVYFLTQGCLDLLDDGGRIINISTGTTRFCVPGYSAYASMKAAVEVFTRYLAREMGHRGIRANVVAPGPVETDFNKAAIRSNPQMKATLSGLSPLGRVGEATDIGGVVAFLFSEAAGWINGQRLEVSGGINM